MLSLLLLLLLRITNTIIATNIVCIVIDIVIIIMGALSTPRTHAAGFQKFNLEAWAQPLGDSNLRRAFRSKPKQRSWDLRRLI